MPLKTSTLTFCTFYFNSLACDHPNDVEFHTVYRWLEDGSLLEALAKQYPDETDFSLFGPNSDQRPLLLTALREAGEGLEGRERKKVGIESCGLHLLVAISIEAIQRQGI